MQATEGDSDAPIPGSQVGHGEADKKQYESDRQFGPAELRLEGQHLMDQYSTVVCQH